MEEISIINQTGHVAKMPIYEYRSTTKGCSYCSRGFDVIQRMNEAPLKTCPKCKAKVQRVMSRFLACIVDTPDEAKALDARLKHYESEGMWSHAAELADKEGLEERAMDDYKKAGYNF